MIEKFDIWHPNWAQFFPSLLATFCGALLGFLSALCIDRRRQKRLEAREKEQLIKRHVSVLKVLLDEIQRNQKRLVKMRLDIDTELVLDYSVTLDVWRATSKEVLDAIREPSRAETVTQLYDSLNLVASALLEYNRLASAVGEYIEKARTVNLPRIKELINKAIDLASRAVSYLGVEINQLENSKRS